MKVLEKHPNPESDWEKNHVQHAQKIIEEGFEISYENAWEEAKKWCEEQGEGWRIKYKEIAEYIVNYNPDEITVDEQPF